MENCREEHGVHSCDKRRTRKEIEAEYGQLFGFEEGFEEEDKLYKPDVRETQKQVERRARQVLDCIFGEDKGTGEHSSRHFA